MRQTFEAFQETAAALDERYSSGRLVNAIAVVALAEVLVGGTAVSGHQLADHQEKPVQRVFEAEAVHEYIVTTAPSTAATPKTVTLPHATPHATKHPKPHVSNVQPAAGYRQIVLPTKAARPRKFVELLRKSDTEVAQTVDDISWPQCPTVLKEFDNGIKHHLKGTRLIDHVRGSLGIGKTDYLIIGVNNGHNFSTNPCLHQEIMLTKGSSFGVYINGNYKLSEARRYGGARNYGRQAARYALIEMLKGGIHQPDIFAFDIEGAWHGTAAQHRAFFEGMTEATQIGSPTSRKFVYGTPYRPPTPAHPEPNIGGFARIMGVGYKARGMGSWIPGNNNTAQGAQKSCDSRPSISNGPNVLSQYTVGNLDRNVICPNVEASEAFKR